MGDDYWFWQRYDALIAAEHARGAHDGRPVLSCPLCEPVAS